MAADISLNGKKGNEPAKVVSNLPNALAGNLKKDPEGRILWIYGGDNRPISKNSRVTYGKLFKDFCERAVLINNQGNKYQAKSALALTIGGITSAILNFKGTKDQPINTIDHLVIVTHGSGEHPEFFTLDEGFIDLHHENPNHDKEFTENADPPVLGTRYGQMYMVNNLAYQRLCATIKSKQIKHIHLHTCFTGKGWYFLRQFAMDTKAIIYAYDDFVQTKFTPNHTQIQRVVEADIFYNIINERDVIGVFEGPGPFSLVRTPPRNFKTIPLRIESAPQNSPITNNGTMILPGWQIRAYPEIQNDPPDFAYIEKLTLSVNGNRVTGYKLYKFEENPPGKPKIPAGWNPQYFYITTH